MVFRSKNKKREGEGSYSLTLWSYVVGLVVALSFALFRINALWSFYVSIILGVVVGVVSAYANREKPQKAVISYFGVIIGLNTFNLVLTLTPLQLVVFNLFYVYFITVSSVALIVVSFYMFYKLR